MAGFDNDVLYATGERLEASAAQDISLMQKTNTVSRINSTGSPEGVVAANPSSLYHDRTSGLFYYKLTGTGNTGWVQVNLATALSGIVPIANGGTNASSMGTSTGLVKYDGTRLVTSNTALLNASNILINTAQPCVSAYISTNIANATGDGTGVNLIFPNTFVNQATSYNTATGVYTAPIAGNYRYSIQVGFLGQTTAHNQATINVMLNGANRQEVTMNLGAITAANGYANLQMSGVIPCAPTNTITFQATVFSSTKTVAIVGLSPTAISSALSIELMAG